MHPLVRFGLAMLLLCLAGPTAAQGSVEGRLLVANLETEGSQIATLGDRLSEALWQRVKATGEYDVLDREKTNGANYEELTGKRSALKEARGQDADYVIFGDVRQTGEVFRIHLTLSTVEGRDLREARVEVPATLSLLLTRGMHDAVTVLVEEEDEAP
jgi:hypothetical protein